ncbi:GGDEF domain-containing protein [Azorhizobium oxalatiphilum]|uniref:GGDEF domain-containing protein n=1 Tax=Azorhizobium oxalatiphilum TaxID=980631 RepID=UPI001662FB6D|nr:diguanylate cyclase [Azorhizobium oxalatiphilum]
MPRSAGLILPAGIAIALIFASLIALSVWLSRRDMSREAARGADALVQTMAGEIQRQFDVFDVLLRDVGGNLQDPAVFASQAARARALARTTAISGSAGQLVLLGPDGQVEASAGPAPEATGLLGRQDYFLVHTRRDDVGLYVSRAFRPDDGVGAPEIALSRRINGPDGRFAGVLVAVMRLEPLRALLAELNPDGHNVLQLMRDDGVVLVRQPAAHGAAGTVLDVSGDATFQRMMMEPRGNFIADTGFDTHQRLYAFTHVARLPLILTVGLSMEDVLAPWRTRALLAGGGAVIIVLLTLGTAILLRREMGRRVGTQAELVQLSMTDGLTGVANRRHFDDMSQREWHRAQRIGSSLAVLMIDIDHFARVNERLGRSAGDDVLRAIGQLVKHNLRRPGDFVARYGGEEFAAVLPDTELYGAHDTAERIRVLIEKDVIKGDWPVTVSIGVAAVAATQDRTMGDLLSAVDRALYRAKESGRNRVVIERLQAHPPAEIAQAG